MMNNFDAVMWSTINHLTSEHAKISFKIKFYYNLKLLPPYFLVGFITWRWILFSLPLFINFFFKFPFSFTLECRIKSNCFCFTITYIFWNSWRLGVMVVFIINFTKLIIILKTYILVSSQGVSQIIAIWWQEALECGWYQLRNWVPIINSERQKGRGGGKGREGEEGKARQGKKRKSRWDQVCPFPWFVSDICSATPDLIAFPCD